MMRVAVGVDPGLHGAVAFLTADGAQVGDMPTRAGTGKYKLVLDVDGAVRLIDEVLVLAEGGVAKAAIELPWAAHGQSGQSLANASRNAAVLEGIIASKLDGYTCPPATAWKRHHGLLHQDKEASRQLAIAHFPQLAHLLKRKKDEGRAEALLIAEYAWQQAGWEVRETPALPFL